MHATVLFTKSIAGRRGRKRSLGRLVLTLLCVVAAAAAAYAAPSSEPNVLSVKGDIREVHDPSMIEAHGSCYLYFAVSTFGSARSDIGLVTAPTLSPSGDTQWTDRGRVFASHAGDDFNAIDANIVLDANHQPWLAFGSFWSGPGGESVLHDSKGNWWLVYHSYDADLAGTPTLRISPLKFDRAGWPIPVAPVPARVP